MHVALVVPGGVDRSGRTRVIPALLWLIEALSAEHRVTVVALGQEAAAGRWRLAGAEVLNVPAEARGPHRLARMVTRGVRAVGAPGRPDVVHGFWASVSGLVAVAAARRLRRPSVVHVAGGELVAFPELGYGGALGRGGRLIAAAALRGADRVTAPSEWMADHVRARGHRVHAVIPLGVDLRRFSRGHVPPAPHHAVQVADLNPVKDQRTLLQAAAIVRAALPAFTLDVFGVDTLGGRLQRQAEELDLGGCVRFCGFVPSDQLAPHLRRAAVHVISSRHDAGPIAVLEAAACGAPTVGTRVGHGADLASLAEPAAVAVAPGDPEALAAALLDVLRDPPRRARLADAAAAWAEAHDARAGAAALTRLYAELSVKRSSSAAASSGSPPRAST
ncbi:MAG: glycosyltransferase family 4 protein [Acidimicrobiales bacterium]